MEKAHCFSQGHLLTSHNKAHCFSQGHLLTSHNKAHRIVPVRLIQPYPIHVYEIIMSTRKVIPG